MRVKNRLDNVLGLPKGVKGEGRHATKVGIGAPIAQEGDRRTVMTEDAEGLGREKLKSTECQGHDVIRTCICRIGDSGQENRDDRPGL